MQYLYLIQCKDSHFQKKYKIGITNDVQSRLAALQTGNPYELEVMESYGFENAEIVERAIHQAFKKERVRGEWFELNHVQVDEDFSKICRMLGGSVAVIDNDISTEVEVEDAESTQEYYLEEGAKFDYYAMFADGWRIERSTSKGVNDRYWCWRKGSEAIGRKYIYGGLIEKLPYPIDDMRTMFTEKSK